MFGEGSNPLEEIWGLGKKAIEAQIAKSALGDTAPPYGIDEYGRAYLRGTPSGPAGSIDPRLVLMGGGLLAIALVVFLAKS
jgi:hypothetical protein